jgi:5-methyltetrahydrofolate--homocysteine methyltransferase
MGTFLQAQGLVPGECPEAWCVSHPDVVQGIAQAYIDAGADLVETNSFGGSSFKLANYGMADRAAEFAMASAKLARQAMGDRGHVAASVGPTGHFLEPLGDLTPEALRDAFVTQIVALWEGGADAVCIETMTALDEAEIAIKAARDNTNLTVIATMTFEKGPRGFRTMMGVSPTQAAKELPAYGAQVIGANCGNGIANMVEIVREMRAAAPDVPILVHANAGMPVLENGKTVFKETPEDMAGRVSDLIAEGASIIGGCCGTTPAHIRAMANAIRARG